MILSNYRLPIANALLFLEIFSELLSIISVNGHGEIILCGYFNLNNNII